MMDVDGDENSVSTYDKVLFKKEVGQLILSSSSLTFQGTAAVSWLDVKKHQVSPINYPKALLKLLLNNGKSNTYQLPSREELERIRKDINARLQASKSVATLSGKKRSIEETSPSKNVTSTSFGELDPTALAVTRSSLLAANPGLRTQHHYLVQETQTLSEDDFWKTHNDLLEEQYARMSGMTKAGSSSLLQSHVQLLTGRVTLGVEEMRQIFILYPAVHKAYEEKVPLELSDEQFWRKYLESEYFHRDRGRLGAASRQGGSGGGGGRNDEKKQGGSVGGNGQKLSQEDQEARAAAVGTDDIFSRYDQKIREASRQDDSSKRRRWGAKLAVGQFDLASTFETERGHVLEGPKDNHPSNADDIKGSQVIQKYNRHWAMVMHPEDATAGSDLLQVARQSVDDVLPGDEDAKAQGGVDQEMERLVAFAQSSSDDANHAMGIGLAESDEYERLTLKNIEAYYSYRPSSQTSNVNEEETRKWNEHFAKTMVGKMKALSNRSANDQQTEDGESRSTNEDETFPPPELAKELLGALTKKMAQDSKTDEDALAIVNNLPEDFKKRLHSYFRRSSELLRHFFGLRKLAETSQGTTSDQINGYSQKQRRIVTGMETVYREMEEIRKELETTGETGTLMRKMYLQIMEQLNWVFKLNREAAGRGGGGGFVTLEQF